MKLDGQVVLITGASRGIGKALAEQLASRGVRLGLFARDAARLESVGGPDALRHSGDVTDAVAVRAFVASAVAKFGRVDVLVNNAGVGLTGIVADLDPHALARVFDVNVLGALHATQAVIPTMRAQRRGHIVNISSILGKVSVPQTAGYAATKFALQALSDGLRIEEAPYGIAVSVICPGSTETDFRANEVRGGSVLVAERPRVAAVSADVVAAQIVKAIEGRPREVITSGFGKLLNVLDSAAPALLDRILARTYHKGRKPGPPGPS